MSHRHLRTVFAALAVLVMACEGDSPTGPAGALRRVGPRMGVAAGTRSEFYIHAHEDDWPLFMGDRTNTTIQAGTYTVFVYTTAGDAGRDSSYWRARERGAEAAMNSITPAGAWTCAPQLANGHPIRRCVKGANIVAYYLRLPDGNWPAGTGYGNGSLLLLRDQGQALSALDGTTTYTTWSDLVNTIGTIVDLESGGQAAPYVTVHAPEWDRNLNPGDHADHLAVGDLVNAAKLTHGWNIAWYVDYDTQNRPVNLTSAQHAIKDTEFLAYDAVVSGAGYETWANDAQYSAWRWRTYFRSETGGPPPPPRSAQAPVFVTGMPTDPQPYGRAFTVGATGGSGTGAYSFAASGACTVNSTTGVVTMTSGTGTCSVTASRAGDANYLDSAPSDPATVAAGGGGPGSTSSVVDFYIHAHEDDWPLFMGDRVYNSVQAGKFVVLVYATAGDAGRDSSYWRVRENAADAAIGSIMPAGSWTCAPAVVNGHSIRRCMKGKVISYYMRLPDGNYYDGTGFGKGSLPLLRDRGQAVAALDNSTTYTTWADFSNTLGAIVDVESGNRTAPDLEVNAPDTNRYLNAGDHPDHWAVADAVQATASLHSWITNWYVDNQTQWNAVNLSDAQHAVKETEFQAYNSTMVAAGFEDMSNDASYTAWRWRTYVRTDGPVGGTPPVTKQAQSTLSVSGMPASAQVYGTTFTVGTSGGSGTGAVTYTATGACTVDAAGGVVTMSSGSGTCSISATKAGDATYDPTSSATVSVAAAKAAQGAVSVTGMPTAAQPLNAQFTVGGAGGSGTGAFSFAASGACSVVASTGVVTMTSGSGTCSVTTTKATDANYLASAASAPATVAAAAGGQAVVSVTGMPTAAQPYLGTFTVGAAGGSGTGAYSFASSGVCTVDAASGLVTMTSGTGTCSITASRAGDGSYLPSAPSAAVSVAAKKIAQAALSVSGMPTTPPVYRSTFTVGSAGGSGTGAVTFGSPSGDACTVVSTTGVVTISSGTGTCTVTTTKATDANYLAITSPGAVVAVAKAAQATVTLAGMPTTVQAVGVSFTVRGSGGSGTGAYNFSASGSCSVVATTGVVTVNSAGTCSVSVRRLGDANYLDSSPSATLSVRTAVSPSALSARGYKVNGRNTTDLAWTPGSDANVDVWRNTTKIGNNVANTGARTDATTATGAATYNYKVCLVGKTDAASCTNVVTVTF